MKNLDGILLMVLAMFGFAMEDLFVKLLSSSVSTSQILITLGLGSGAIFACLAHLKGHNIFSAHVWTRSTVLRMLAEAIAALAFITSLSLVPISTVAAVFQVTPLAITMGASLIMGEQVGWRRWTAIILGFCGVLIIIRPGMESFDPSVLFVLVAVLGVAARDLITRTFPDSIASTVISFQAFASLIFAGLLLMYIRSDQIVTVSTLEMAYFLGAILFGVTGYYGIVASMRVGDVAIVTPFRYMRLVFSIIIGVLVFSEKLDQFMIIGSVIVIGTGLYTLIREQKLQIKQ